MPEILEALAPPVVPAGLFTAAVGPLDLPTHGAIDGITFVPDTCGTIAVYPAVCDTTPPPKTFTEGLGDVDAARFILYSGSVCGLVGTPAEVQMRRLARRFAAREQWGAERAFWGPAGSYLPSLGLAALGAGGLVEALALLEQAAADNYGLPVIIHARPALAPWFSTLGLLDEQERDGLYRTFNGNVVVFGKGYAGTTVAGAAPVAGTETMFATGRVIIWRAPDIEDIPVSQTVNRQTNQLYLLREREYAVAHECFAAAVTVNEGLGV